MLNNMSEKRQGQCSNSFITSLELKNRHKSLTGRHLGCQTGVLPTCNPFIVLTELDSIVYTCTTYNDKNV